MDDQKFCQSCAMPMTESDYGTEADGSKSADYCQYCYQQGKYTSDETMESMIEACAQYMVRDGVTADEAKAQMRVFFPQLKRWASA